MSRDASRAAGLQIHLVQVIAKPYYADATHAAIH